MSVPILTHRRICSPPEGLQALLRLIWFVLIHGLLFVHEGNPIEYEKLPQNELFYGNKMPKQEATSTRYLLPMYVRDSKGQEGEEKEAHANQVTSHDK